MTPLLLLPGHMCDARLWGALDFDDRPIVHADLGSDDRIEPMAERVLDAAPSRFIAAGFSMGGIVALQIARRAPERLAGLALIDTNAAADLPERSAARLRQQAEVRAGRLREVVIDELKPHYLSPANTGRDDIRELTLAMALDLGGDVFLRQSEALRTRPDATAVLPAIACPALVVCGADDPLCPPSWHRAMARAIPQAALAIVADAGHLLPLERPEAFGAVLHHWLSFVDGDPHAHEHRPHSHHSRGVAAA